MPRVARAVNPCLAGRDVTVFTKNRDRLLKGEGAEAFFRQITAQARVAGLLSDEPFTVDGTLLEACAGQKSFRPEDAQRPGGGGAGGERDFHGERRTNETHASTTDSAIDKRTTRHTGYEISQRKRKLVEQPFGWMKTVGLLRRLRHRGQRKVGWTFSFTAAVYNLVRVRTLGLGVAT
jgi:hypothetical protein